MSIHNQAVLIKCTIGLWRGQVRDNGALTQFLEQHKMAHDAGSLNKHLISKTALKGIFESASALRDYHRRMTAAWNLDGVGLITNDRLFKYMQGMNKYKDAFNEAVEIFLRHYDIYVSDAQLRLGDRYIAEEFPDKEWLKERFYVDITPMPVPSSNHILIDLAGTGLDKSMIDKAVQEAEMRAMERIWNEVYVRLNTLHNAISDPNRRFKSSSIEILDEYVDKIRDFNFYKNEQFDSFCNFIETHITCNSAEDIRKHSDVREAVVKAVSEAITACKPYIGEQQNGTEEEEYQLAA